MSAIFRSKSGFDPGDGQFRVKLRPERHGLLIRARDSCVRIPVQIFTVALIGLRARAGAPPGGLERNEKTTCPKSLRMQPASARLPG